jgi:RNA polymerase sigma-70 factor (ECF subfamily)
VDRYGDALFHFAMARVNDRIIAEDLVLDTFLAAVKAKERYKGKSSEKTPETLSKESKMRVKEKLRSLH